MDETAEYEMTEKEKHFYRNTFITASNLLNLALLIKHRTFLD
jgi:hypothetical protein